jgi:hypothetical protein
MATGEHTEYIVNAPRMSSARLTNEIRELCVAALGSPWFISATFTVFILIRVLVLLVPFTPTHDAEWYLSRSADLSEGGGYAVERGPTAYYPIGWPAFLAVFFKLLGTHLLIAQLVNLALAAGTFFLVLSIARTVFSDEFVARATVLFLTLYPNNIAYVAIPVTETFFTFVLLLGWLVWIRSASAGGAAVAGVDAQSAGV